MIEKKIEPMSVVGGSVRYWVLAATTERFVEYVRLSGRKLQDCNCLTRAVDCQGLSFTSPLTELVVLAGWTDGGELDFMDAGHLLIARYCRDNRVHDAPMFDMGGKDVL